MKKFLKSGQMCKLETLQICKILCFRNFENTQYMTNLYQIKCWFASLFCSGISGFYLCWNFMQNRFFWLTNGAGSFCLKTVGSGRPEGYGRTSGSAILAVLIVFGPFLQISILSRFCIILDSNLWYMLPCLFYINELGVFKGSET